MIQPKKNEKIETAQSLHRVGCVGKISSFSETDDGRYLITLNGISRFELKEIERKQSISNLENKQLQKDIENKNRELAVSTMSMIKKNQFLNKIKNDLNKTGDSQHILRVIKTIDKNLNNEDDWRFFEEAFNNADREFLKKIKRIHNKLTKNDLKLCAYLRLNLSSKDIAPLLNISLRSVEIKRYRLRKKMKLSHNEGLTEYVLSI